MQQRAADSEFFDSVLELVDHYRRTNANVAAETYSSPASTEAGNRVVDDILGADRTNVTEEIAHAARLQRPAAACVLNVAVVLLLKSLEPEASHGKLDAAPSRDRLSEETSGHSSSAAVYKGRVQGGRTNGRRCAGQRKSAKFRPPMALVRCSDNRDRRPGATLGSDSSQRAVAPVNEASPSARDDAGAEARAGRASWASSRSIPCSAKTTGPDGVERGRTKSLEDVAETPKRENTFGGLCHVVER